MTLSSELIDGADTLDEAIARYRPRMAGITIAGTSTTTGAFVAGTFPGPFYCHGSVVISAEPPPTVKRIPITDSMLHAADLAVAEFRGYRRGYHDGYSDCETFRPRSPLRFGNALV